MATLLVAPVIAADAPPAFGFVDLQAVFSGYDKTKDSNSELETLGKQLDQQLTGISQHKLLEDKDMAELTALLQKPAPTSADKDRLKALDDIQAKLDAQLKELQGKKDLTAQEQATMKDLMDRSAKADESITKTSDEYEKTFEAKKEALSKGIRDDMLKAIDVVAKEKSLSFVVDKVAVLYGGTDITQPVIDQLNKKK